MFSGLWGKITGKDEREQQPRQQASFLGRIGDYVVVFPYGLYADLPADTLLKEIAPGVAIPVTVGRPSDTEQGEPALFHPATNTRIIARNNGDLDMITTEAEGDVNIQTVNANITASEAVNIQTVNANITASASATIDTPLTTFTGDVQIDGALNVDGDITSLADIIAAALLQGATLSISGNGSIGGKDFLTHKHGGSATAGLGPVSNTGTPI